MLPRFIFYIFVPQRLQNLAPETKGAPQAEQKAGVPGRGAAGGGVSGWGAAGGGVRGCDATGWAAGAA